VGTLTLGCVMSFRAFACAPFAVARAVAVALAASVLSGERMPFRACRMFGAVALNCVAALGVCVGIILALRSEEQMFRIDAGWIVATMAHDQPVWNIAVPCVSHCQMGRHVGAALVSDQPVAFGRGTIPVPAIVALDDVTPIATFEIAAPGYAIARLRTVLIVSRLARRSADSAWLHVFRATTPAQPATETLRFTTVGDVHIARGKRFPASLAQARFGHIA